MNVHHGKQEPREPECSNAVHVKREQPSSLGFQGKG